MFKNINKSAGQASRLLLVLAVVVLVAVIIVYLVMKMADRPVEPPTLNPGGVELPVYEKTLGNIRFVFASAIDRGSVLRATSPTQKDLVATAGGKFIQVTIGAQNVGTENTEQNVWDINNIVDSNGRNFIPVTGDVVRSWLPSSSFCGALLKPAFDPLPCTKIYEVSKISTGLKIGVESGKNRTGLLDLIVK